ncbi:MAG: 3-methyl-2-oxobutanoate hydroxymethyltransferase [Candidatus Hydrogenedentota bacterium]|nr:MAG: 3-methyl-2-oxobutanoate hydroxymethyltransferase [Candidatus Hydrogenedentota bacterium]
MSKVTAPSLKERKMRGEKLAVLTAYDYPTAKLMDECSVDAILVGDSCAMVVMGRENTLSLTVDEILHHVKMVSAAAEHAFIIADMPFLSYQISTEESVRNAGRLVAEGGAHCVKLEGPARIFGDTIRAIQNASIPVMGHLGLTPQSIHVMGGYKVQGKDQESRKLLKQDALELDELGCCAIVLECIPPDLAEEISASVSCPTIGIGAGAGCDGQVLVMHDMMGWGGTRFTKTFTDVKTSMEAAFNGYITEVKAGTFPAQEHQYS